jgi:hypothetical protein
MKAFPSKKTIKVYAGKFGPIFDKEEVQEGMDLRDYFAAKAMQGMLSSPNFDKEVNVALICAYSYTFADEMMRAREI